MANDNVSRDDLDARLAEILSKALVNDYRRSQGEQVVNPCPVCGGTFTHPPNSSACKRVKLQKRAR